MTRTQLYESIKKVIGDCMPDMDLVTLKPETLLAETEIESMGFMLILCRLEAMYEVRIPDDKWSTLLSVNDVIDAFMKAIEEK